MLNVNYNFVILAYSINYTRNEKYVWNKRIMAAVLVIEV